MNILAIESSCDDTGIAIVKEGHTVLSSVLSSQIRTHSEYGGIVPELASRMHTESIHFLLDLALQKASLSLKDLDAIAVTYGPGLEGSLLVGTTLAKLLSKLLSIPLIGVNHIQGHIYAPFLTDSFPSYPFVSLIASGGHTSLVLVSEVMTFELLSQTRDDACGEAFDKVARMLSLGYPGGPIIEKLALSGNPKAFSFPRALKGKGLDFSFSGLKTAVKLCVDSFSKQDIPVSDICASFQEAVIDSLIQKSLLACELHQCNQLSLGGGVTANQTLLSRFKQACEKQGVSVFSTPPSFCTDNAAMIGCVAYFSYVSGRYPNPDTLRVRPALSIVDSGNVS